MAPIADELGEVRRRCASLVQGERSPRIKEVLEHTLAVEGKQLRSGLLLLASKLGGKGDRDVCINLGVAIEILHLATLIHDDMVDHSELRRGRRTLNAIWGEHFALMVGDLLFGTSIELVCAAGSVPIVTLCSRTVRELAHGQLSESVQNANIQRTRDDYEHAIYEKTACLFACAGEVGGLASGADGDTAARLAAFGRHFGMAYQIADDIADYELSPSEVTKSTKNDLKERTMTLPAIVAVERGAAVAELKELFKHNAGAAPVEAVQRAYAAVIASGAVEEARTVAARHRDEALGSLRGLPENAWSTALANLAEALA